MSGSLGLTMRFHVVATWNGNTVVDGRMSGVMAYETIRVFRDNYSGRDVAPSPTLDRIINASVGDLIRWEYLDKTGNTHVTVLCER